MNDEEEIRDQVEARVQEEIEHIPLPEDEHPGGADDPRFVRDCLNLNEMGDGKLFASMMFDLFVYNKTTEHWLRFNGNHWDIDKMHASHAAVEQVALKYTEMGDRLTPGIIEASDLKTAAEQLAKQCKDNEDDAGQKRAEADAAIHGREYSTLYKNRKAYYANANKLRSLKGAKAALEFSHKIEQPIAIYGDELDKHPLLLPCANGVISQDTGKINKGDPADYLLKAVNCEYHGINAECDAWLEFMDVSLGGDKKKVAFVKRLIGYASTGLTTEHFIACFVGEGRNGKGTMFEMLQNILGELAWTIQPELILEQKNAKSSAGPSADLIALMGRRIVIASETDENRKISGSRVKMLTGGDTICARAPHDKYDTNFTPTHTLFLQTNHIPKGLTKDFALLKRLLFIHFPCKFVDNPDPDDPNQRQRDPHLKEKLLKCRPGILGWIIEGCLEWQRDGLNPPASVLADIENLRQEEDIVGQFIADCCIDDPGYTIAFATIYEKFKTWYADNISDKKDDRYIPNKRTISDQLIKKGYVRKKVGGVIRFTGLNPSGGQDDIPYY